MILVLISWFYIFYISLSIGLIVNHLLLNRTEKKDALQVDNELIIFGGISIFTTILAYISIFSKISTEINLGVVILSAISNFILKTDLKTFIKNWFSQLKEGNTIVRISKLIFIISILLLSLISPNHGDSGFYHAQAIQWSEQYPVIPGLGNFFGRIAFNSSFFITQAYFSFNTIFEEPLHLVNSFLTLIFSLWILRICYNSYLNKSPLLIFNILMLFLIFLHFRGWVSSAAPDIVTGMFVWIPVILFMNLNDQSRGSFYINYITICITSFIVITFKISSIFIILVPIIITLKKYNLIGKNRLLIMTGIGIFIISPFLIRNYILSGYLIYPFPGIDIFNPDWKIPLQDVQLEKITVHAFTRIPQLPVEDVIKMTFRDWFPVWFFAQSIHNKIIILLIPILTIVTLTNYSFKRNQDRSIILLYLVLLSGIIFWFVNAPDFRFGYGFLIPFLALNGYLHGLILHNQLERIFKSVISLFILYLVASTTYLLRKEEVNILNTFLFPEPYPKVESYEIEISNVKIKIPKNEKVCWNTSIPCLMEVMIDKRLRLRGEKIEEGFYKVRD